MLNYERFIRDPIHDYIPVTKLENNIIDTKYFQRLRNINQNAIAFFVYPGLRNTRFEHSLGVMHIASKMMSTIINKNFRESEKYLDTRKWFFELATKYPFLRRKMYEKNNSVTAMLKRRGTEDSILNEYTELLDLAKHYEKTVLEFENDVVKEITSIIKNPEVDESKITKAVINFVDCTLAQEDEKYKEIIDNLQNEINMYIVKKTKKHIIINKSTKILKKIKNYIILEKAIQNKIIFLEKSFKKLKKENLYEKLIFYVNKILDYDVILQHVRVAALLHDIGHLPFSHAFEQAKRHLPLQPIKKENIIFDHEILAKKIISNYYQKYMKDNLNWQLIILMLSTRLSFNPIHIIKSIISGQVDADRADYLLRDHYMGGFEFGSFDLERLISNLRIFKDKKGSSEELKLESYSLAYDIKALSSATRLIIERYNLSRWLHYHHTIMLLDGLVSQIISYLIHYYILKEKEEKSKEVKSKEVKSKEVKSKEDTVLTLLKNEEPFFSDRNKLVFLDEAFIINELRKNAINMQKVIIGKEQEKYLKEVGITNIESLIESLISRKNLPIAVYKYVSNYWSIFIRALIDGLHKNRNPEIKHLIPEYSDDKKDARDKSIIFANSLFIGGEIAVNLNPVCGCRQAIIKNFYHKMNERFGEKTSNWINILMCKKTKVPYDMSIGKDIILVGSDNKSYLLSDLSIIVNKLKTDYELKVPKVFVYIQTDQRKIIKDNLNEIQDTLMNTIINVVSDKNKSKYIQDKTIEESIQKNNKTILELFGLIDFDL